MKIYFKDELFDGQFLRALSHVYYGGADIGECFATAHRIQETNADSWYQEWSDTAQRIEAAGDASLAAGEPISAREAFLRASNYYRTAYLFLFGTPVDQRVIQAYDRQTECFQKAGKLFSPSFEAISIPYENTSLPGYFFRVDDSGKKRPTLLLSGGYDGTAEESYFFNVAGALRRGYNCLCFDGPGQGGVIVKQGLVFRPDWENVITPVRNYLETHPEVDQDRVALIGLSFSGYLATRAVCFEHRFAAYIADPGEIDLYKAVSARIPGFLEHQLPDGNPLALATLREILNNMARQTTKGWSLRRGMWTHGAATPLDYINATRDYTAADYVSQISCPTLVCYADADPIAAYAQELFDKLTCPKAFMTFSDAEGAGEHCEIGSRAIFHQRTFDWLNSVLQVN